MAFQNPIRENPFNPRHPRSIPDLFNSIERGPNVFSRDFLSARLMHPHPKRLSLIEE
jgi:hypothetical protein